MINDVVYPDVEARLSERRELFRIAAQTILNDRAAGRKIDPHALQWAKHWAAVPPLGRPLGTGEVTE